jgi:hypothetical protein
MPAVVEDATRLLGFDTLSMVSTQDRATPSNRERWLFRVGLLVLGIALYGPWLTSGYLLGYDWVSGPRSTVPPAVYGLAQGRAAVASLAAVIHLLGHITFGVDPVVVLLALSPLILGRGLENVLGDRPLAWFSGALLLSVNPFVDERLSVGSFAVVLAIDVFPFLVAAARKASSGDIRACMGTAILVAVGVGLAAQVFLPAGLLIVAVIAAERWRSSDRAGLWKAARGWAIGIGALGLLSAYWLLPTLLTGFPAYERIGHNDLNAFASRSDPHVGLLGNLIGLYGFWRPGVRSAKSLIGDWWLFLVAILVVIAYGMATLYRSSHRRLVGPVALLGLIGLLIAFGARGPTGSLFTILYDNVPGFRSFREPEKGLWLLLLAYALFFGWGVSSLVERLHGRSAQIAFSTVLLGLPVLYGVAQFWGLNHTIVPSHYPRSWLQTETTIGASPGRILFLPWHEYQVYPFAGGRVVADPAPAFFSNDVLVSQNAEIPTIGDDSTDPRESWVQHIQVLGPSEGDVGQLLRPLGVRWIILYHTTTWNGYEWLFHQQDIVLRRHWNDLDLLENLDWAGEAYVLTGSGPPIPLARSASSPIRVPITHAVSVANGVVMTEPFNKGWQIGNVSAQRDESGTNYFPIAHINPTAIRDVTFRPWAHLRFGVVISGMTFLIALTVEGVYRYRRTRHHLSRSREKEHLGQ